MARTECRLIWYSSSAHLDQLHTGFLMLHQDGLIRLSQVLSNRPFPRSPLQHLKEAAGAHLTVVVNGGMRLHYDCHDAVELNEQRLEDCDFYFKRSFSEAYVAALPKPRARVLPLGLCYKVLPDAPELHTLHRTLMVRGAGAKLATSLETLDDLNWLKYTPRVRDLQALPEPDAPPRVLFLAAAYDPYDKPERSPKKSAEIERTNEMRARCIELLRSSLGAHFYGGFVPGPYSSRAYPRLLVDEADVTRKRHYIRLLRSFPVCVATTGLHGSIGWKFAEYVALAKAIVSEKLNYQVPGDLAPERNYLEFTSPEQCVEQAARLLESRDERSRLMFNNARYYQAYLRPDVLVLSSLLRALSASQVAPASGAEPQFTPRIVAARSA
jgi:hypothetical protein